MRRSQSFLYRVTSCIVLASIFFAILQTCVNLYVKSILKIPSPYPVVNAISSDISNKNIPTTATPPPWQQARTSETFKFPIAYGGTGPSESLFSGPKQYPFLCQSLESGLGQPIVDNQDGYGTPVFQENSYGEITSTVAGYSKDCSLPTRWQLKQFKDDKLIIRIETGTINRFIYALLIPTTSEDTEQSPDLSQWNGALIYHFKGAIGIGYQQGKLRLNRIIRDMKPALKKGYAIAFSTGNETDNHYNITLQEDTALRVKQQFIHRYGQPKYTIGFGDSGGALQQYLLSQNNPTLLQAGVAVDAYPDMVSQITYGLDCPLLEYYFDYLAADKPFWHKAQHRSWVSGLSFNNNYTPRGEWLERLTNWLRFNQHPKRSGATECNYAWRGSVQLVNNPRFNSHHARYSDKVLNDTHWSHWQDNQFIYGTDEHGYAQVPWSNVGVQYGLQAWKRGHINAEHFFDLNQKIGSWLPQKELQPENFWLLSQQKSLFSFSPYQTENFSHKGKALNFAPRIAGSINAARGAYNGGHIFTGRLNMPLIDVRRYRDDILDIHHSWSAISSRQRIIHHDKSDANRQSAAYHSIWIADKSFKQAHWLALEAIEQWLSPGSVNSAESVAQQNTKPDIATDRCFDKNGQVIASGHSVWDGTWNQRPDGHCTQRFPFFRSSRQVAGESAAATILFCQRISIDEAITTGIYSPLNITTEYRKKLQSVFPQGVCDYSKPDSAAQ